MTPSQIELARHALGLPNEKRMSYRNRYVVGKGCADHDAWCAMVAAGEARQWPKNEISGGNDFFSLTLQGAQTALIYRENLDPEDFPALFAGG